MDAWKDPASAREAAARHLGEWYGRFETYLFLLRTHDLPMAKAREVLEALRDVGRHVDRALDATKTAVERFGYARFAVAGTATRDDLYAAFDTLIELERAAVTASEMTFALADRAETALRGMDGSKVTRPRLRQLTAEEAEAVAAPDRAMLVFDVPPQLFADTVFAHLPDAPRNPAYWALFAIAHHLDAPPSEEDAWEALRAQWGVTVRRAARGGKAPGSSRRSAASAAVDAKKTKRRAKR